MSERYMHTGFLTKPYHKAVRSLLHTVNTTRPDIAYLVNCLTAFLQNPCPAHWKAVQHLLTYLKGTLNYKIM
jgi:hypothetical protein